MRPIKEYNLKWLLSFAVFVLFSCQKENSISGTVAKSAAAVTNSNVNIYVAGMEGIRPIYWKNSSPVYLSNLGMTKTTCLAVSENDVYVGGFMHHISLGTSPGSGFNALYFKNGIRLSLAYGTRIASANSIVVSGTGVYVAGTVNDYAVNSYARYWNGSPVTLSDGLKNSSASSIAVSGTDIYVAGNQGSVAQYWKNGKSVNLTNGTTNAYATSIAVSGTDVYVAGYEDSVAKYWKNGIAVTLSNHPSSASSIAVSGADVYVAGTVNGFAAFWRNGVATTLSNPSSSASAIAVSGTDVYVAGTVNGFATYWKNGVAVSLSNLSSSANSIFITR